MKYLLLGIIGVAVVYETVAWATRQYERYQQDAQDDGTQYRIRLAQRKAADQIPGEIVY